MVSNIQLKKDNINLFKENNQLREEIKKINENPQIITPPKHEFEFMVVNFIKGETEELEELMNDDWRLQQLNFIPRQGFFNWKRDRYSAVLIKATELIEGLN